jgi:hypothetical protein|eukprot:CAMPEP_0174288134 /NCGR_PEP_ID=MMETSP0809-20121228/19249_1 /TAXON_ID=73025 ORGANISM="Eutreptiella gymnastica-like, Strain CCMP1594" /NCGR_SAMPLE_ID=MMETSP0809 /ASSEMBLY_ACC=CAM_ASM_000658 /LENGTH=432 /DNA_ID=CAMNT_0015385109 /DNA_START=82 /DNA_END=1380 /DNA_ORIENTATION=+
MADQHTSRHTGSKRKPLPHFPEAPVQLVEALHFTSRESALAKARAISRKRALFNLEFVAQFQLRREMDHCQDPDTVIDTIKKCLQIGPRSPAWWWSRVRWFHKNLQMLQNWIRRQRAQREHLIGALCEFWESQEEKQRGVLHKQLYKDAVIRVDQTRTQMSKYMQLMEPPEVKRRVVTQLYWARRAKFRRRFKVYFGQRSELLRQYNGLRARYGELSSDQLHGAMELARIASDLEELQSKLDLLAEAQPRFCFDSRSVTLEGLVKLAQPQAAPSGPQAKQVVSRSRKAEEAFQVPMWTHGHTDAFRSEVLKRSPRLTAAQDLWTTKFVGPALKDKDSPRAPCRPRTQEERPGRRRRRSSTLILTAIGAGRFEGRDTASGDCAALRTMSGIVGKVSPILNRVRRRLSKEKEDLGCPSKGGPGGLGPRGLTYHL